MMNSVAVTENVCSCGRCPGQISRGFALTQLGEFQMRRGERGAAGGVSPSQNMWISHLGGKRSCKRVNNLEV